MAAPSSKERRGDSAIAAPPEKRPPVEPSEPRPAVSVVMPCLDEEGTVGACVAAALRGLASAGVAGEVLVADNGSRDRSRALAAAAGARVVAVAARGYGAALRAGIAAARADVVVMGDSDGTYDFSQLAPFLRAIEGGADLVMGNRFRGGIADGAMPLLHRRLGNPLLTRLARLFFGVRVGDVYCGLRAFRRDAIERLALRSDGMEYALEMLVKATLHRLPVAEVPTTLSHAAAGRESHLRTWRDGRRSLRFYLLCAPNWLFLYPGLALAALGAIGMTLISTGAVAVAGVRFDIHTLLYCAMTLLIGTQAIGFAFFGAIGGERAGLLPPGSRALRELERFRVEFALLAAATLVLAGIGGTALALAQWRATGFGSLDPFRTMRIAIPSATAIALGCQVAFTSFYAGVLKHTGRPPAPRDEMR